jgi:hypothetical protein
VKVKEATGSQIEHRADDDGVARLGIEHRVAERLGALVKEGFDLRGHDGFLSSFE